MYRPLPHNVTIKQSTVEGLGLFATEDISAGMSLGISHFLVDEHLHRTPLGAFYNHSNTPNIRKQKLCDVYWLHTTRHISAGEELLCTYTFYNIGDTT